MNYRKLKAFSRLYSTWARYDHSQGKLYDSSDTEITISSTDITNKEAEIEVEEEEASLSAHYAQKAIASSSSITLTVTDGSTNFKVDLSENVALSFAALDGKEGVSGMITLVQDATGGRTFTLPSVCKTPVGGATITQVTTANSVSMISYYVLDSSNVLVNYIGDFS